MEIKINQKTIKVKPGNWSLKGFSIEHEECQGLRPWFGSQGAITVDDGLVIVEFGSQKHELPTGDGHFVIRSEQDENGKIIGLWIVA